LDPGLKFVDRVSDFGRFHISGGLYHALTVVAKKLPQPRQQGSGSVENAGSPTANRRPLGSEPLLIIE